MNGLLITVEVRSVYGNDLVYPVCDGAVSAKALAECADIVRNHYPKVPT